MVRYDHLHVSGWLEWGGRLFRSEPIAADEGSAASWRPDNRPLVLNSKVCKEADNGKEASNNDGDCDGVNGAPR